MLGMLDYRAYKLRRLIWLPFNAAAKLSLFLVIVGAIIIAQATSYSTLIKILIAYVVFELAAMIVFQIIWALVFFGLRRSFFWFIDVVPARGQNQEEAEAIALYGRLFELNKKFLYDIARWTREDTDEYISFMNWRARLFYGAKLRIRLQRTAAELQRNYNETGQLPSELGITGVKEARKKVPGGEVSFLERLIVGQPYFNSVIAVALIVFVIGYFGK